MAGMVHFNSSILRNTKEQIPMSQTRWENVAMAHKTVKYLSWDARYCDVPGWLWIFPNLAIFACHDRRHYIGDCRHQEMISGYRPLKSPEDLRCLSKLWSLDLSYPLLFVIPEPWNKLKSLSREYFSYNQSSHRITDWPTGREKQILHTIECDGV